MARKCPNCFCTIPATKMLVYSGDVNCTSCHNSLEFSAFSRNIAAFGALILAAVVFRVSQAYYSGHPGALGWVFPVLFAYLAYSVASPILLVFVADLQLLPFEPAPVEQPHSAPVSHSSHHGSH